MSATASAAPSPGATSYAPSDAGSRQLRPAGTVVSPPPKRTRSGAETAKRMRNERPSSVPGSGARSVRRSIVKYSLRTTRSRAFSGEALGIGKGVESPIPPNFQSITSIALATCNSRGRPSAPTRSQS